MKVQLAPWRITDSSISIGTGKGKRLGSSNGCCPKRKVLIARPDVMASIIVEHHSDPRHSKKRTSKAKKRSPVVSLTSSHRITILSETEDSTLSIGHEDIQFASRPGQSSSFLANGSLKSVASVFDDQANRVYALQKNNSKLVSFSSSNALGTESESSSSASVTLDQPALDMNLLSLSDKTCIVYGTCLDGKVYVARCVENENGQALLRVEYFGASSRAPVDYVGTLGQLSRVSEKNLEGRQSVGKRKRTEKDEGDSRKLTDFFQVTRSEKGVSMIRHRISVQIKPQVDKVWTELIQSSVPRDVEFRIPKNLEVGSVSLVGLDTTGDMDLVTVMYSSVAKMGSNKSPPTAAEAFVTTFSLNTAQLVGGVLILPANTEDVCSVGRGIVASVTTSNDLLLFQSLQGVILLKQSLNDAVGNENLSFCKLLGDPGNSRVVILFNKGDFVSVASSVVEGDTGARLSSSCGLSDSLEMYQFERDTGIPTSHIAALSSLPRKQSPKQFSVAKGLDLLQQAGEEISVRSKAASKQSFLRDSFTAAVCSSLSAKEHPKDAHPSSRNGKVVNGKKNGSNGFHAKKSGFELVASKIPAGFAGSAAELVVRLVSSRAGSQVGTVRKDARFALRHLVRSGHISARAHLSSADSFCGLLRGMTSPTPRNGEGASEYTSFDFINDILDYCPDVSERQMVASLRYTLIFSNPHDIADFFGKLDSKDGQHQIHRKRAEEYRALPVANGCAESQNEVEKTGAQVKLAGATWLIKRFLRYSSCNDALLRHAFSSELKPQDCRIVMRLFSSVLRRHGRSQTLIRMSPNMLQWVAALADAIGGQDGSGRELKHIRKTIGMQLRQVASVLQWQSVVKEAKISLQNKGSSGQHPTEEISSYQIDHLVF